MVRTTKKPTKQKSEPEVKSSPGGGRTIKQVLSEKSTWCGLLTIGAALATGGLASYLNPTTLPFLTAGIGLILTPDGR